MKELFIVKDYDTGEPFSYILCENAEEVKKAIKDAEENFFNVEENSEMFDSIWDFFISLLKERNIKYEEIDNHLDYLY